MCSNIESNQIYRCGVLVYFYQQGIEPINEAGERLGIPRGEFIRQAYRSFIAKMNDTAPVQRFSSPPVNESDSELLPFYSFSGTGF